jgi:hypothetical protein
MSDQMPGLGEHALNHRPCLGPLGTKARADEVLPRMRARAVCANDIGDDRDHFVDNLHW